MSLDGRKFLDLIYYETKEIRHLNEVMETRRLSTLPGSILPNPNPVQTSPRLDPLGDALASAADLSDAIQARVVELNRHKKVALDIIYTLDNPQHRTLLIMRYVKITEDGRRPTWDQIASELDYTTRHTLRMHGEALAAFNDRYCSWSWD